VTALVMKGQKNSKEGSTKRVLEKVNCPEDHISRS